MPEVILNALANAGIFGPFLAAALWYIYKLGKDLKEVQEKRTQDAQEVVTRILDLADRQNRTATELQLVLAQHAQTLGEVKEALRDIARGHPPSP